jgi:hypothetical protein
VLFFAAIAGGLVFRRWVRVVVIYRFDEVGKAVGGFGGFGWLFTRTIWG